MKPETVGFATIVVYSITVVAIIVAPIIALRVQRQLDEAREAQGRRLWIFKTLMTYRATRLNPLFVQALNMIDIEFTAKPEKEVRDKWKELADHYDEWGRRSREQQNYDNTNDLTRAADLLAELLVKMGASLGYEFDKVYIKKGCYYPEGLSNIEQEQHALRRATLNLLSGQGAKLPVAVFKQDFQPLAINPLPAPEQLLQAPAPQLRPAQGLGDGHEPKDA